ncbi:MAG: hypothetical protein ACYC36_06025 [Bellilinea sp.]
MKEQHGNCVDCKFRKVDMFEEPCTTCAWIESGTFDNWQPNDVNADIDHSLMAGRTFEEKPSKRREKQLQAQVDTYRLALNVLMLKNDALRAERDEARKVAKHIYENKQLIFKYAWLEP